MNDLVHIEAEVRILGLRYQIMAGMERRGEIEHIWPKMAYNGTVNVLMARYDKFQRY